MNAAENSPAKLTDIAAPKWSSWNFETYDEQHTVQVGPKQHIGEPTVKRTSLKRYDVFLDGEHVGHVEQTERSVGHKPRGLRYATRVTHSIEWVSYDLAGNGYPRLSKKQRNEAVYELALDTIRSRREKQRAASLGRLWQPLDVPPEKDDLTPTRGRRIRIEVG
ncbi:hypothetical protein [Curtobacterium sp. MCBD17_040]|uniref:hypothetical protein n=1 Tax=Curtobacterium sp. MCBD17_040 TaxID=2175674 RepID=UPI000DA838BB|nr:hypothetical protein [Curtobacterium sp. MCBD17_040]WIB65879.1 hypothetical protein DEI94_17340 [Curtobacterium sp. MCBD17_040]